MRKLAKSLALTCTAVGVAAVGVAAPAQAAVARCGQVPLNEAHTRVLVVTCAEADGDQRRGRSTVVNLTDKTYQLTSLRSLISSPAYAETECGASPLRPNGRVVCVTPWVTQARPGITLVFSLVRANDPEGNVIRSHVSNVGAQF